MPIREFHDAQAQVVYYTVICDRCLRVGPTCMSRKEAFVEGGFFWHVDDAEITCDGVCPVAGIALPDRGGCPSCDYTYNRYDRILELEPYVPGEPCPGCGLTSSVLHMGEDVWQIDRVFRGLPDDVDIAAVFQVNRQPLQRPTLQKRFAPKSVWRGRDGNLFAILNQCSGQHVDITIDPHDPNGRKKLRMHKDNFLDSFECVAVP